MKSCTICKEQGKYKCPICLIYYCSVVCCRKHREDKCEVLMPQKPEPVAVDLSTNFTTADTVPRDKLAALEKDPELKNILSNPHLRKILMEVDSSAKPDKTIQKAMLEPLFVEFADACMRVVEPPETSDMDCS